MNINFSFAAFNSVYANQAGLSSIANSVKPVSGNIDGKIKKPLNMDTVTISARLGDEIRNMAHSMKAEAKEADQDNLLAEKTDKLIESASATRAHGMMADGLKVADDGIKGVMSKMDTMKEVVEKANDDDAQLTDRDRAELQKEIDYLKEEINKISERVMEETADIYGDLFRMDCERFGIQDLSVLTEEDALNAVDLIDNAIREATEMQTLIKDMIKELEEKQQDKHDKKVNGEMDKLENQAQKAEDIQNAIDSLTDEALKDINDIIDELADNPKDSEEREDNIIDPATKPLTKEEKEDIQNEI